MAKDLKAGQRVVNRFTGAIGTVTSVYEQGDRKLAEVLYDGQDKANTGIRSAFQRIKRADLIDGYASGVLDRLANLSDLVRDLHATGVIDPYSADSMLRDIRQSVRGVHLRAGGTMYEVKD